jgi:hypothetical protein
MRDSKNCAPCLSEPRHNTVAVTTVPGNHDGAHKGQGRFPEKLAQNLRSSVRGAIVHQDEFGRKIAPNRPVRVHEDGQVLRFVVAGHDD